MRLGHVSRMPCGVVSVVVGRVRSVVWPVACALACARVRTGGARRVHRAAPGETRYVCRVSAWSQRVETIRTATPHP